MNMLKGFKPKKSAKTESAENQRPLGDEVTKKICNVTDDALSEKNTLQEEKASEQLENVSRTETTSKGNNKECLSKEEKPNKAKSNLKDKELYRLRKRIMRLRPGQEIEWVTITKETTKHLTTADQRTLLLMLCNNLNKHEEALVKAKIMLVKTAQKPDRECALLEEFYNWLLLTYQLTPRQQLTKIRTLLKHKSWSWEKNPMDELARELHKANYTWDDVVENESLREEIMVFIKRQLPLSVYLTLCESPMKDWGDQIIEVWKLKQLAKVDENKIQAKSSSYTRIVQNKKVNGKNEKITALNAEVRYGKRGRICPRCRKEGHPVKFCPLPRKRGRGSQERKKIRQKNLYKK